MCAVWLAEVRRDQDDSFRSPTPARTLVISSTLMPARGNVAGSAAVAKYLLLNEVDCCANGYCLRLRSRKDRWRGIEKTNKGKTCSRVLTYVCTKTICKVEFSVTFHVEVRSLMLDPKRPWHAASATVVRLSAPIGFVSTSDAFDVTPSHRTSLSQNHIFLLACLRAL